MTAGRATPTGTAHYASQFPGHFYVEAAGLRVSSLGLGTYLGEIDERTDAAYTEAIETAVAGGINFLDSAINYRHQRSERSIGAALDRIFASEKAGRDAIVVCTKAGFLTPGVFVHGALRKEESSRACIGKRPIFSRRSDRS